MMYAASLKTMAYTPQTAGKETVVIFSSFKKKQYYQGWMLTEVYWSDRVLISISYKIKQG